MTNSLAEFLGNKREAVGGNGIEIVLHLCGVERTVWSISACIFWAKICSLTGSLNSAFHSATDLPYSASKASTEPNICK